MVNVQDLYNQALTLIRKSQQGLAFSVTEFNRIIPIVNLEIFNNFADKLDDDKDSLEALKDFTVPASAISLTAGVGSMPSDYEKLRGDPYILTGGVYNKVELVTFLEFPDRQSDELTKATVANPICYLAGVDGTGYPKIYVFPTSITSVNINYLKLPATPLLDYYVASTGIYTFMAEDATGVSLPSGATARDGTTGPDTINSETVDFEWHEDLAPLILYNVLQKAGLILEKGEIAQFSLTKEAQEND